MISHAGTTAVELERLLTFGADSYPVTIVSGPGARDDLARRLAGLDADRFVLVADTGVPPEIRGPILECLRDQGPVTVCELSPGEGNKTLAAAGAVMTTAFREGATRRSVVVAMGGGQAGNIAGLAAALMYRGPVRLLHIPTTLLAVSDSVVSRKQAVNLGGTEGTAQVKNTVGVFKTPEAVWADLQMLRYLPGDEIRSGLCEAVKNLVAILPELAPEFASLFRPTADYTDLELIQVIDMCLSAKQAVMRHDPCEKGEGLILEYGHTAGHAIELACGIRHGFAIGVGGLVAARVARILRLPGAGGTAGLHEGLLRRIGAPVSVPPGIPDETWTGLLLHDNKRGYRPIGPADVEMVLLEGPGIPHCTGGLPLTQVPAAVVLQAIRETERAA